MATALRSSTNALLPSILFSSSSSPSPRITITVNNYTHRRNAILSKTSADPSTLALTKRGLALSLTTTFTLFLAGKGLNSSSAAILEADDDLELLEKVKKDRKKRLERQEVINSSKKEAGQVLFPPSISSLQ